MVLRRMSRPGCALGTELLLCATTLWACSDSANDADTRGMGYEPAVAAVGGACTHQNATSKCDCPGGTRGRQVCNAGSWQQCECNTLVPSTQGTAGSAAVATGIVAPVEDFSGNLRTDVTFPWKRTTPDMLACEAGHYEGSFAGLYYSRLNCRFRSP